MKRFLLFVGHDYTETELGWDGFWSDFDTTESARNDADKLLSRAREQYDWFHIVDTDLKARIEWGWRRGKKWTVSRVITTTTTLWDFGEG